MPPASNFPTETPLPQFNKRNHTENQGGGDSGAGGPVGVIGLIIAALTLLVAMTQVLRCQRFRSWVTSFSISSFVKRALGIVLPNPPPKAVAAMDLSDIPLAEDRLCGRVITPRRLIVGFRSDSSPYCRNVISTEDGRAPQVGEPPRWRRPGSAVTWHF